MRNRRAFPLIILFLLFPASAAFAEEAPSGKEQAQAAAAPGNESIPSQIASLEKQVEANPSAADLRGLLTSLYAAAGDWEKAAPSAEKALELNPNDSKSWSVLGSARYLKKDYPGAVEAFKKAAEFALAKNGRPYVDLAAVYLEMKENDRAIEAASKAVEQEPGFGAYSYFLGRVYYESGKYAEAVAPLKRALELKSEPLKSLEYLALSYAGLKDTKQARETFQELLKRDPESAVAKKNLGNG